MTTETIEVIPRMGAEAGYEIDEDGTPLRLSGFLTLLLGLLSFFCTFGQPLLVLPVAAFAVGAFALRRYEGQMPIGVRPAMLGMVLAAAFGACGLFLPWFKTLTLAGQAEQYSRYYMEMVARGEDHFAIELNKDYVNRLPTTMDWREHYAVDEGGSRNWQDFREESINDTLRARGPNAEWVLERPTRVYYSYGRQHADVIWMDPTGSTNVKVQVMMEYQLDQQGQGQWHVKLCQAHMDRITAPGVL